MSPLRRRTPTTYEPAAPASSPEHQIGLQCIFRLNAPLILTSFEVNIEVIVNLEVSYERDLEYLI